MQSSTSKKAGRDSSSALKPPPLYRPQKPPIPAARGPSRDCANGSGSPRDLRTISRARSGGLFVVLPVHCHARFGHPIDNGTSIGICCDKAIEIGFPQHEKLAIGQCDDISLTRLSGQQRHFAEKFAGPKPDMPVLQPHLERARSDKEDGVAARARAKDQLVRNREAGPEQPDDPVELRCA